MLKTKQKIKLARLIQVVVMAARRLTGNGPITRVTRKGLNWELDLNEGIDFSIWLLGSFEPETVRCHRAIVRSGDTVLDIGANVGAHTVFLAQEVGPNGRVIAFEPTDYAFDKLSRNISLNPNLAGRVTCLQYLLGDTDVAAGPSKPLYSSWPLKDEAGLHHLHQGRLMTTERASTRTLDSAIASLGLGRVDCVKLDIDGAECSMLRGAGQVLSRWHPTIIMELAPYVLEEKGASLEELVGLLQTYDYGLTDAASGKALSMDAKTLHALIPPGASLNVVARPRAAIGQ